MPTPDLLTFSEMYSVPPRLYLYVGGKLMTSSSKKLKRNAPCQPC